MPKQTSPAKQSMPWWLEGEEECPQCHQLYAYELEIRCIECDEPSCPHCMKHHVERGIVCVACEGCEPAEEAARG
jgi:hypothetical protein